MSELINCAACLRATRDWHAVELREDGAVEVRWKLCRACRTDVFDVATRLVQDKRLWTVQR